MYIKPEDWNPVDLDSMEDAAIEAIKEQRNTLVLAGPGAGKTELLAQKAAFLLQMNTCPNPKRVLAISFKKDAASNLKDRVALRCGSDLSRRFESYTFSAFAQSILCRFRNALPNELRPSSDFKIGYTLDQLIGLLRTLDVSRRPNPTPLVNLYSGQWGQNQRVRNFEKNYLTGFRLDDESRNREYILSWAADRIWELLISGDPTTGKSILSYNMISRLAEYIIRNNEYVRKILNATYSHVFLDEFQDTTGIQYEFLQSCFLNFNPNITAVGDGKQRIMLWAGSLETVFSDYTRDFSAIDINLVMNYRCAPRLVELQTVIAQSLVAGITPQISSRDNGGIIRRIDFRDSNQEATELALKVQRLVDNEGVELNEICFLFKQLVASNSIPIIEALNNLGYSARNEDEFQELLKEDLIQVVIYFFKYTFDLERGAWTDCMNLLVDDYNYIEDVRVIESELKNFRDRNISNSANIFNSESTILTFVNEIIDFISIERIQDLGAQYTRTFINEIIEKFSSLLISIYSRLICIASSIKEFEGEDVIPCMTIHKSKGLEFKVVVFVGLDDQQFWSFGNQSIEDTQAFFVAASRPMEQLYLTYSNRRNGDNCSRTSIQSLYDLLNLAGVEYVNYRDR